MVRSAMFGHAIADAMGVPVEFQARSKLRQNPVTGYRGYGSHNVPAGIWSDDTGMALATLDSLAHGLDYADIMKRFCDWKLHAAYTATNEVFDMGITTNTALSNYLNGIPALECGCGGEYDNGNGSLMRIIPSALYCKYALGSHSLDEQLTVIHNISALTHTHPRSQIGCGIYSLILMELCDGKCRDGIQAGIQKAQQYYESKREYQQELQHYHRLLCSRSILDFAKTPENEIKSDSYVVSTLEAAIWCVLNTNNYSDCVLKAVNLGDDTDTVAAVAGGLAGCLYGMEGIPNGWYAGLIRADFIEKLCAAFAQSINAVLPETNDSEAVKLPAKSGWQAQGEPLPEEYLRFTFEFHFTAKDMEMFRTDHAHTSLGFMWVYVSDTEIYVHRGLRYFYRLVINPETDHHFAYYYIYGGVESLGDLLSNMTPKESLIQLLKKWTRHPEFLKTVDLHCHIIPGVDDGAQSVEMALKMVQMEYDQGVRHIACTSHSFSGMRAYRENLIRLQKEVTQQGLHISLYPGCEIDCTVDSISTILKRFKERVYPALGNSRYMLLEFSPYSSSHEILSCIKQMFELGKFEEIKANRIVLAHVERYHSLSHDSNALDALLKWGCLIQINAYSLEKEPNNNIKNFARRLLAEKKVSFLGSDAHRTNHRPPDMASGVRYVYDHCDVEYANAVCYENAKRLLTGALG